MLLLVTNWFFHRVYWSEWIGRFHRKRKALEKIDRTGFFSAQAVGFVLLGLTSVYREGFETVLFLQSLQVSAGTATVVEGAALGLALTLGVGVFTFLLQRKLPYKRMLVVTGVMIGFVLVVMVGQTARTMQGVGWLSITPIGGEPPYWLGRLVRRLSELGDARRAGVRGRVRDRLVLRGEGDEGQAAGAACPEAGRRSTRATDTRASAVMTTALATHHWQIASIFTSST